MLFLPLDTVNLTHWAFKFDLNKLFRHKLLALNALNKSVFPAVHLQQAKKTPKPVKTFVRCKHQSALCVQEEMAAVKIEVAIMKTHNDLEILKCKVLLQFCHQSYHLMIISFK